MSKSDVIVLNSFGLFTVNNLSTKICAVDEQKIWGEVLTLIKDQISSANFKTWFGQAFLDELTEGTLTLVVPSAFIKNQLTSRYQTLIEAALEEVAGRPIQVNYRIDSSRVPSKSKKTSEVEEFDFATPASQPQNAHLNPKYTLENFVVGLTNNLAYAAAQAVTQNPGTSYNPLFIYGPSGVGKTHLMQAIGNALLKKEPHLRLMYCSSERFMVDFVDSIQTKRTGDFRSKYRNLNLLLIDDIQFISGKDSTQEEFFHTFNELHGKGAQVVLTSDRPPSEIQKLESRLSSRFQGGLMVDIQLPDFDTRVAILKAKLTERGESLPEEGLSLIAEAIASNTRELEGKLTQIMSMIKLTGQEPSAENIGKLLGKPQATTQGLLDPKKILGGITRYFEIKMAELTGPKRQKQLVIPRQIAMFILYDDCKVPMERIGQMIGGRDHTTILHGIDRIREGVKRDRELQRLVIEVRQALVNS